MDSLRSRKLLKNPLTRFRPCIDLHQGQVKQIVGGTLDTASLATNFVSDHSPAWYAELYRAKALTGAHVIALGPGNTEAAQSALAAWPQGLQFGGGVNLENAKSWLEAGASHVIVTSWLFEGDRFALAKAEALASAIGPEKLVIDLSCRRHPEGGWRVATQRWQTITQTAIDAPLLRELGDLCAEFLVHAADVEGLCQGMDEDLIRFLGEHSPLPTTYAGGASRFEDLARVEALSGGRVDLTIGSALDLFGGSISLENCVAWNQRKSE